MSLDASADKLIQWKKNPVQFVEEVFKVTPDPWQHDALMAFPNERRMSFLSSKGTGKSCMLAWLVWNFLVTRFHPLCVATSISQQNLSDGLWAEMARWMGRSDFIKDQFEWTKTRIHLKAFPETWFLSARTWPKSADTNQQANTLAGLHADNLLFILDEVGGIPDSVMAAAEAGLANDAGSGTEAKIVMAGNPTHLSGPLYRSATTERHMWWLKEITSDPDDPKRSPRVSMQWAREQIEKYGRDNPWVLVNVFGKFPPSSLNSLLGVDEVTEAMQRSPAEHLYNWSQKRLGVDVARQGDDRCFDDKTEILTDQGWKLFSDLSGDEKVLSVGANEHKAEWADILHIHKAPFDGHLNLYEKTHLNFCITDNHRMFIRTSPKLQDYTFRPFKDLPKDFVVRELNGWRGSNPILRKFVMAKEMPHGGIYKKTYSFDYQDWAAFLGWFVSEGSVYEAKRRPNEYRINIAQLPGAKMESIKALLTRMGVGWRLNNGQVEFSSIPIGQFLIEHCKKGCGNKRIPKEIKEASEPAIQAFLDAFLAGDGSCRKDGTGRTYRTTSKELADDIQECLAKLGKAGLIRYRATKGTKFYMDGREITRHGDLYIIYERSSFTGKWCKKASIQKVPYKGFVWCVATPKESIMVRRNGVPMWSGNTCLFPRQGLMAFAPVVMRNADTNEVTSRVIAAKAKWGSEVEFIDGTGGFGAGVIDNMRAAGYSPIEVQYAGKATDPRFYNKRAEMWFSLAEWIRRGGALPNIPELVRELTEPQYTHKNGKLLMEPKEQLKARLGYSPDMIDSLSQTFFYPDEPARDSIQGMMQRHRETQETGDWDPFDSKRL